MATKLIGRAKIQVYLPSLRQVVKISRSFSSASDSLDIHIQDSTEDASKTRTVWPDDVLGPLGPQDRRFPLPGRVGPCLSPVQHQPQFTDINQITFPVFDCDSFLPKPAAQRHMDIMELFLTSLEEIEIEPGGQDNSSYSTFSDRLVYQAFKCPRLLRKEFKELFANKNIMEGDLTLVTVCQNVDDDLDLWTSEVESRTYDVQDMFVQAAVSICHALEEAGHWADFIDPSTGQLFKDYNTKSLLKGGQNNFKHQGFEIEDIGNARLIYSSIWGMQVYVGYMFTSAPLSHPLIEDLTH